MFTHGWKLPGFILYDFQTYKHGVLADNNIYACHCEPQMLFLRRGNLHLDFFSMCVGCKITAYKSMSELSFEPKDCLLTFIPRSIILVVLTSSCLVIYILKFIIQ